VRLLGRMTRASAAVVVVNLGGYDEIRGTPEPARAAGAR
jgi:hypothetical protein